MYRANLFRKQSEFKESKMRSFGVMGGGFRPASTLIQHRKLRPRRVQQLINQQREKSFTHFNKTRFQIFNSTTQHGQIKLMQHQFYLSSKI